MPPFDGTPPHFAVAPNERLELTPDLLTEVLDHEVGHLDLGVAMLVYCVGVQPLLLVGVAEHLDVLPHDAAPLNHGVYARLRAKRVVGAGELFGPREHLARVVLGVGVRPLGGAVDKRVHDATSLCRSRESNRTSPSGDR